MPFHARVVKAFLIFLSLASDGLAGHFPPGRHAATYAPRQLRGTRFVDMPRKMPLPQPATPHAAAAEGNSRAGFRLFRFVTPFSLFAKDITTIHSLRAALAH